MSSFSVHGKHARNPTTWSRLGLIDFSAKIFTVHMDWVKLVGIIFWKTVVNTSRRNLKMWISRRRRRRWVLYLNDYGSNKEFGEFARRVHQRCQFRRVNAPFLERLLVSDLEGPTKIRVIDAPKLTALVHSSAKLSELFIGSVIVQVQHSSSSLSSWNSHF